jgi:signal peptidase II
MIFKSKKILYFLIFVATFGLDRLSKFWALTLDESWHINRFLSFDLALNRGVSWGLFHSSGQHMFILLTAVIMLIICAVGYHTYNRMRQGKLIIGEVLILSGALSNVLDRILYGGVVDFILLSVGSYSWPVFNCADTYVVLGVFIMFLTNYNE